MPVETHSKKAPHPSAAHADGASRPAESPVISDALFKSIFSLGPEAIVLTRAQDGTIAEVNQEWLRLTGFTREEVLGRTAVEIGHWSDERAREEALTPLKINGRITDADIPLTMKDGIPRIVRMNANLVELEGEAYILIYLRDVTADRLAQEAMLAGEKALERAYEKLNRQVKLYEMTETVAKVGHWATYPGDPLVHFSHGYMEMAGMPGQNTAPLGTYRTQVIEEDRPKFAKALREMNGETVEYRWAHPDGSTRWIRSRMHRQIEHGEVKADFGIVQEITSERSALEAVGAQLAFIQKITGRAPGVLYEFQSWPDGRMHFPFMSAGIEQLIGVTDQEIRDNPHLFFNHVHREDLPNLLAVTQAASRALTSWEVEIRTYAKNRPQRWLLGSAVPESRPDGSVLWCGSLLDITSHKLTMERLQQSEMRFRSLTELSSDWYWEQDADFRFVRVDGNMESTNGVRTEVYVGKTRWESGVLGVTDTQWALHRAQLERHEPFRDFEMQRLRDDGSMSWVSISGTPILGAKGEFRGYRGTGRDITARKQAEADIERLAFFDALTGLPNRRLLIDRLNHALEASARHTSHGALLFIDLDNFKILNDTMGHHTGDELLKQVAERLSKCVRSADTVARLGGDEFVVMLEDIGEMPAEAAALAENVGKKILLSLNQDYALEGQRHHSSPSIGVTLFFQHNHSLDELLKRADLAMYQAKAAGRNTLRFFDPQMQAAASARATLEADMRMGLERNEFLLYYQPVVDAQARITGVEALVRWQHPERGLVPPGEFISMAEQTGLILPLGQWVLETACAQLVAWSAQATTERLTMAVNVSARQFRHPEFSNQLLGLLRVSGANPYRLKLELTESLLLSDIEDAIVKMGELRSIGVNFSLDDFGTGYSSLSYLKRLPLDQLKIDQSFVHDVLSDPNDAAIARTILNLAQSLDLGVVAEGVETQGQHDFLLQAGCKAFQGYLFGRPVPVEQLVLPAV
jgi:diguanylate cyclase (GGDEF)-like protein/PAS domain S-box-containing protein